MNKVTAYGNLVADVTAETAESGTVFAKGRLASDNGRTESSGTSFLTIVGFNDTAKLMDGFKKGEFCKIEGSIRTSTYTKDDETRYSFEIVVKKIERVEKKQAA